MSYLGNTPETYNFVAGADRFSGNASTTRFLLTRRIGTANDVIAIVENVIQDPFTAYTVSANTTSGLSDIVFDSAPPSGTNNIVVNYRSSQLVAFNIVTEQQLQANSVTTSKIANGAITADKIADGTVIAADIADGAVTGPKLGLTAINANNIVDASITGAKLAAATVTGDKLGLTAINANNIVDGTITGVKIAAGSITGDDLAANIIRANNIVAATITGNLIATGQITGNLLATNIINANNIVDGTITTTKLNFTPVQAGTATTFTANQTFTVANVTNQLASFGSAFQNIIRLTDAATITPNLAQSCSFIVTLGGNRTMANATNTLSGQSGVIFVQQDGTGSRTLSFGTGWRFPGNTAPTLTTTGNAVDMIVFTAWNTSNIAAQAVLNVT